MKRGSCDIFHVFQFVLICLIPSLSLAQTDHVHYSKVFGREKPYRIFLPSDYSNSGKRYPVIYYFHGNTGTHELDIPGVNQLVDDNKIILVAWNGRSVDSDMRPYNIGNHSNINYPYQFKDYFPELVAHIDSTYRTVPDRDHRAVIGHSMGGIMSFFIAGKYPDMICSAYNSKGSPEFFIGFPNQHSLYHVRYMFKNLHGVRLGFSSGTSCELKNLNAEVIQGGLLEKGLDFRYTIYEGPHTLTAEQFTDAIKFTIESFRTPPEAPARWHHADLYPDFDIWGYQVRSNLKTRGFIDLKGVTRGGLEIGTRAWEPDGIPVPGVQIQVKTPPIYKPNTSYTLLNYTQAADSKTISAVRSDASGRITLASGAGNQQFGIFLKNDPAEITLANYRVNGKSLFLDHMKECRLSLELLNRGGKAAKNITVTLSSATPGVTIANPTLTVSKMESGELAWLPVDFLVTAANKPTVDGSPFKVRFNLTISDDQNHSWEDEFDAAAYYKVSEFIAIGIDDGDSEIFGSGNGNNIAEPGETVMIYEISNGSHRLRLYYDDPYIDSEKRYDEIQPDKWGDGYSLSSLIHISKDCPPGHTIRFLACYEIKDWKEIRRDVTWGTFSITIGDPNAN